MFTVKQVINAYQEDLTAVLENKSDSNRTKKAQRDRVLIQILNTLPQKLKLSANGTAIDPQKLNAGEVVEIAVRYHFDKAVQTAKTLSVMGGQADLLRQNGSGIEVKLCLNGCCYNTPVKRLMTVYLVTSTGVYLIPKKPLTEMLENSAKLPYKEEALLEYDGVRKLKALSLALGFTE